MAKDRGLNLVKSQVIYKDYSKDAERTALVSGENLAHMFGKIARWYTDISWVGHTHTEANITDFGTYAGASTKGGAATSANKLNIGSSDIGSETKPVYFNATTGKPVACAYSLNASVPANAVFTDINVKQSPSTADESREVLFAGNTGNTDTTGTVGKSNKLYFNPSTGALTATSFSGSVDASNLSGTIDAGRLPTTAVTAGSYGPAAGGTLAHGGTFDVAYVTVDKYGRLTAASTKTFTLPAQYVHPTYTSKTSGLYKITVDGTGHVSGTAAVTASDLPAHTHDYLPTTTKYALSDTVGGCAISSFSNHLKYGNEMNISKLASTGHVWFGYRWDTDGTVENGKDIDRYITKYIFGNCAGDGSKAQVEASAFIGNASSADIPYGFSARASSASWTVGGTFVTGWDAGNGCEIAFVKDYPASKQLSCCIDGYFFQNEGKKRVLDEANYSSYVTPAGIGALSTSTKYALSESVGGPALSVSTKGDDVVLGTASSSTNDSGDIVFLYGDGTEKMRIWTNNDYSAKSGPLFRLYSNSGTQLYNGTLVLSDGTGASGTWNITAASANKLNTNAGSATNPVYFSNGVPVACSYSLNRNIPGDYSVASQNTSNYPYHLLCYMKDTTPGYKDYYAVFRVTAGFDGQISGVYEVTVRMNGGGTGSANLRLISGYPFRNGLENVVMGYSTAGSNTYVYVFLVCGTYARTTVRIIQNGGSFTFVNSSEVADTTASDKKTSTNVYASMAAAGTALVGGSFATTQTKLGVGNIASSISDVSVGGQLDPVYFSNGVPVKCKTVGDNGYFTNVAIIGTDGVMEIGKYIDMHISNGSSNDYDYRITNTSTSSIEFSSRAANNALKLYAPSGHTRIQFQTAESNKAYTATGITAYPLTSSGMTMTIESGGNMIIGGGESPSTLVNNDFDNCTSSERESLYLAADASIIFASNVQTFAERKCAVWENLGCFRPFSNNTLSIGRADYYWNKAFITQITGGSTGSWIAGRDNASIKNISVPVGDSYAPVICVKTNSGAWTMGSLGSSSKNTEHLYISYTTDANYSAGSNSSNNYYITSAGWFSGTAAKADKWSTARTITIGSTGKSVDGSGNVSWSLSEIGAAAASHSHNLITRNDAITFGASRLQWFDLSGNGTVSATTPYNPGNDWFHHIMLNHGNDNGYYVDLAICFHQDLFYYKRISNGTIANANRNNGWVRIIDSSCIGDQTVAVANDCRTVVTTPSGQTEYALLFAADPSTSENNTVRKSPDIRINYFRGAANTEGISELVLGNSTAYTSANNSTARIALYNARGYYSYLYGSQQSLSGSKYFLPQALSGDTTLSGYYTAVFAWDDANTHTTKPWKRILYAKSTSAYDDRDCVFMISYGYVDYETVIAKAHLRTNGSIVTDTYSLDILFETPGFNRDKFRIVYTNNSGNVVCEVWFKNDHGQYASWKVTILSSAWRTVTSGTPSWEVCNNTHTGSGEGYASYPTGTGNKGPTYRGHTHMIAANGYWGMMTPAGATNDWIRTTSLGIIPYQSGGAGSGHQSIGTSSWYFLEAYIDNVHGIHIGSVKTAGGDIQLTTPGSSSNDSGDIIFYYGNGNEKSRFWMANEYTAKSAPYYRVYNSSGTQLYNGCLVLGDGTGASGSWNITAASANKWATARTLTLTGSVTGSASIDGSGNVSLATTTNHTHSYLPLSGGTMTGDITFTAVTSTSYPATSCKLYWTGSTDWAKIYYCVAAADAGRLVLDIGDDANARIDFAYNGTTKSYIDTSGNFSGRANTTEYINITAGNEIRFNVASKPSSAIDLYIGYAWSDGTKDAKIQRYKFENGNGALTKVQASTFEATSVEASSSITLGTSSNQGSIILYNSNNKSFSVVASPDATAGGGITLPPTSGLMTDIVYKASSGTYGALGKVENTGCIASLTASDISSHTSRSSSTQSFGGTYTIGSTWYNMLSIRHRNGSGDGGSYGFYIRNSLTSSSSLVYNQQYNGSSWRGEATIVDSLNVSSYAVPNTEAGVSTAINKLSTGSSTPSDADYYVSQYAAGGTTNTSYHRRPVSALFSYINSKLYKILWSGSTSCTARSSTSITLTTAIAANKYRFIKVVWNCGSYTGISEFRADTLNVTNNIPSGSDATTTNMIQFKIASDGKSITVGPGTAAITVIQIAGVYPI